MKHNHQRGYAVFNGSFEPWEKPDKDGRLHFPTLYFEKRESSVNLKIYVRLEKLPGSISRRRYGPKRKYRSARKYGDLRVRLEWTLKGKDALKDHVGGNQLKDLINFDLNRFLAENLRLKTFNHCELGKLLDPKTARAECQAIKTAEDFLRTQANAIPVACEDERLRRAFSQHASVFTLGNLLELSSGKRKSIIGRPRKRAYRPYNRITPHRIEKTMRAVRIRKHLSRL